MGVAAHNMGSLMLLDIVAATVLGGTSLFGGVGSIIGTLFGVLLLGTIGNTLNLLGISYFNLLVVKGVIILVAVSMDVIKKSRGEQSITT